MVKKILIAFSTSLIICSCNSHFKPINKTDCILEKQTTFNNIEKTFDNNCEMGMLQFNIKINNLTKKDSLINFEARINDKDFNTDFFDNQILAMEVILINDSVKFIKEIEWIKSGNLKLTYNQSKKNSLLCLYNISYVPILIDVNCGK